VSLIENGETVPSGGGANIVYSVKDGLTVIATNVKDTKNSSKPNKLKFSY